jgi:hypothetical protein
MESGERSSLGVASNIELWIMASTAMYLRLVLHPRGCRRIGSLLVLGQVMHRRIGSIVGRHDHVAIEQLPNAPSNKFSKSANLNVPPQFRRNFNSNFFPI